MDIQEKEWGSFVEYLKTKGVIKIGRNALGVITDLVREGGCTLGYNDLELMWETWRDAKAQAVPEEFVLVPKLSANYLFNKVPILGFKHQDEKDTVLYHLNYMASEFKDSARNFIEDDHAKQKVMIEAQKKSHV